MLTYASRFTGMPTPRDSAVKNRMPPYASASLPHTLPRKLLPAERADAAAAAVGEGGGGVSRSGGGGAAGEGDCFVPFVRAPLAHLKVRTRADVC